ncbi:MAG: ABC transporter permease [Acidobacteriia bacterium]|nr:ABC transporter permease [Terriglobia bacterium]
MFGSALWREMLRESWDALRRNPLRSSLTMLGIVWGIVAVTVLLAYGGGFRDVLVRGFEAFGKSTVVCWPGQTSEQAGGERAGRRIRFERADLEAVRSEATLVRAASLETVRWVPVAYGDRLQNAAVRGVYPEYGELRNEVPSEGRWLSYDDLHQRRRVIFLGGRLREKLFSGRPAVGEVVRVSGVAFTVIGVMDRKIQLSNYFGSDDESAWIPYSSAGDLWDNRYASVLVFGSIAPQYEAAAMRQVREIIGRRQRFSPTDERAILMFGREQFRPIIDGITIGLQVLLLFIGVLTLGIGGVGVMNIMLVSVDERTREIGLRRALGARRWHIQLQFLAEALLLTLAGGLAGILLAQAVAFGIGTLPLLGPLFEDDSGRGDITLRISWMNLLISSAVLMVVGVASGWVPAVRAARLDPVVALRYE